MLNSLKISRNNIQQFSGKCVFYEKKFGNVPMLIRRFSLARQYVEAARRSSSTFLTTVNAARNMTTTHSGFPWYNKVIILGSFFPEVGGALFRILCAGLRPQSSVGRPVHCTYVAAGPTDLPRSQESRDEGWAATKKCLKFRPAVPAECECL